MAQICYNCNSYATLTSKGWECPTCKDDPGNTGPEPPICGRPDPPPAPPEPRGHHWLQDARIADLVERVEALERELERAQDDINRIIRES